MIMQKQKYSAKSIKLLFFDLRCTPLSRQWGTPYIIDNDAKSIYIWDK